jgi:dual specificity MAP kinase phosphatase
MSKITPTLWLSGESDARNPSFLQWARITHILNCADDSSPNYPLHIPLIVEQIPMEDDETHAIPAQLDEAVQLLDTWLEQGHTVLVHCRAGISRSPTVILAWLIRYKHMSFEEAWSLVVKQRNIIQPNPYFMHLLRCLSTPSHPLNLNPKGVPQ